jgi:hypothetical protein
VKTAEGRFPSEGSFLCFVCRRYRKKVCHVERLDCCASAIIICEEKCAEMIPRSCRPMTVADYAAFYRRVHEIVCRNKYRM